MRPASPTALALTAAFGLLAISSSAHAGDVHALTEDNRLVTFDDATPGTLNGDVAVTGLSVDEELIALEVQPCDGRLFALSDQDRIYTIDPETGAATVSSALSSPLGDTTVGAAFDPETLELRVVDESDGNRSVDVDTGAVTAQTDLQHDAAGPDAGRDPFVSAITIVDGVLLAIDTDLDELVAIDPAADGTLTRIGRLGLDAAAPVGLDYRAGDETLFASVNVGGLSGLYAVDPATGHIRFLGTIGDGATVIDVAAAPTAFEPLQVDKLDLKLNFKKAGKDMIHVRGAIPVPEGDFAGVVATVDVGGVMRTFTLAKNGKGTTSGDTFHLEGKPKNGLIKYDVMFKKGEFADDLADEGMGGTEAAKNEDRQVVVVIVLDGVTYASEATVVYTAKVGKNAKAKLSGSTPVGSVPGANCPAGPGDPTHTLEIRGNSNTVTVAIGAASSNPFVVTDNDQNLTVFVASTSQVEIILRGNGNTIEVPSELFADRLVTDTGNENSVVEIE